VADGNNPEMISAGTFFLHRPLEILIDSFCQPIPVHQSRPAPPCSISSFGNVDINIVELMWGLAYWELLDALKTRYRF
jgi:hypothetical protein